jgi:AmmeMemoRadiSam system protein B/AmmeMemoRadiSam system protein A
LFLIFGAFLLAVSPVVYAEVKDSDLAGSWYPASKPELENQLKSYMDAANPEKIEGRILAIISPHAGYIYSGPVAAYGYKAVQGRGIKTVILIGFSHKKRFDGIAAYDRGSWRTPLGDIQIDEALAKEIVSANPRVKFNPGLFDRENSVEMQVPFIQLALGDVKLVPLAFGTQNYSDAQSLAATLALTLKGRKDCLIVASSDMSHYHPYDEANRIDRYSINIITALKARELYEEGRLDVCELCGLLPVTAALLTAKEMGYDKIKELKYANSGDITGDKSRVVGYLSAAVYKEEKSMLNNAQRKRLLVIARESLSGFVRDGKRREFTESDPMLNKNMGAFVTLNERGQLRGCIGNMVGSGPLYKTVANMAIEAATGDPRFPRLSPEEINKVRIEVSVLSPLKKVSGPDEITIPGDGVIVKRGFRSGVYLPQVATETGWGKEEFLTSLCAHKAGLAPDAWKDPATEMYTFTAEVFGEEGESHEK